MASNNSKKTKLKKGENLSGRAARYARELKNKKKDSGEPLSPGQAGYRFGVLSERSISAEQYNYKKKKAGK